MNEPASNHMILADHLISESYERVYFEPGQELQYRKAETAGSPILQPRTQHIMGAQGRPELAPGDIVELAEATNESLFHPDVEAMGLTASLRRAATRRRQVPEPWAITDTSSRSGRSSPRPPMQPERAVALAQLTERSELDLVTFQDHPYHPAFLDTWTLLAYTAARTSRVSLSGNVLNLPLRGPAILAKSAASLDLLSGGRFELGLGAGAFWDAIAAYGGTRLTPGQAVDALDEGIRIIRGIWDADERAVLKVDGEHHHVVGAKRGPAPAHDIGIWLGALKPRMLRLVGRAADGWLPSLSRLEAGALAEGNKVIDDAASGAGRDPRAIRRLLNIGTSHRGRAARRVRARGRDRHVHPRDRRPRRDQAVRARGRAGRARARRRGALERQHAGEGPLPRQPRSHPSPPAPPPPTSTRASASRPRPTTGSG